MQETSPEEYTLMTAWTYILVDGINALFGAISKDPKTKGATEQLKQAASKAGIKMPDLSGFGESASSENNKTFPSENNLHSSQPQNTQNAAPRETINLDTLKGQNLAPLKNPQVKKAMCSSHADMKFEQYEKMGLLDLCLKQRKERLGD